MTRLTLLNDQIDFVKVTKLTWLNDQVDLVK